VNATITSPRTARVAASWPVAGLVLRLALFVGFQCLFAIGFAVLGARDPWREAAAWWLLSASLACLVNLAVLVRLLNAEGLRFRDLIKPRHATWKRDLLLTLAAFAVAAPIAYFPNPLLATALFGSADAVGGLMFQPLPLWAIVTAGIAFPITIALTELPTYYAYAMPRLKLASGLGWQIILLVAFAHALQHVGLPFLFDVRFIVWRLGMFLPFAIFLAWLISRRPSLLPFLMIGHGMLDAQLAFFVPTA
jgi:hypothetical protein